MRRPAIAGLCRTVGGKNGLSLKGSGAAGHTKGEGPVVARLKSLTGSFAKHHGQQVETAGSHDGRCPAESRFHSSRPKAQHRGIVLRKVAYCPVMTIEVRIAWLFEGSAFFQLETASLRDEETAHGIRCRVSAQPLA